MLKDFMWEVFEHTGNVDSYIFYSEMKERDKAEELRMLAEAEAATAAPVPGMNMALAGSN